jgi:CheY-like chemotaxis protein
MAHTTPAARPAAAPVPLAAPTAAHPAATSVPPVAVPAPARSLPPARPPRVLLADDSKVVRVKTGRLLEKQGWQVLLAEDGAAALQLLDTEAPDLLITDVEMPGLDGFELTRQVRAHARFGRMPVIMITSSDERHRAEADAAGVNLLLGKPYAEEALLAQVQQLLDAAARRAGSALALH